MARKIQACGGILCFALPPFRQLRFEVGKQGVSAVAGAKTMGPFCTHFTFFLANQRNP